MQDWLSYKSSMYRFVFCLAMSHCSFFYPALLRDASYVRINEPKLSAVALSDKWSTLYFGKPLRITRNLVVLAREVDGNFLCITDNRMLQDYVVRLVFQLNSEGQSGSLNLEFVMIINPDKYKQLDCYPRFEP